MTAEWIPAAERISPHLTYKNIYQTPLQQKMTSKSSNEMRPAESNQF
jgi:hypothetical protein